MNNQTVDLIKEVFTGYPLKLTVGRRRMRFSIATDPRDLSIEKNEGNVTVKGIKWSLMLTTVSQVQMLEIQSDNKSGRRLSFLDAKGSPMFQIDLRRPDQDRAASFDRLQSKYAAIIADAPPKPAKSAPTDGSFELDEATARRR